MLEQVSLWYVVGRGGASRITHPFAADGISIAQLACVRPVASVRSEPGSNSFFANVLLIPVGN